MVRHRVKQSRIHLVPVNLNRSNSRNRVAVQMKTRKNRPTIQTHSKTITITMEITAKMANHAVNAIKMAATAEAEEAAAVAEVAAVEMPATVALLQKHRRLSMKLMRATKRSSATITITIT